MTDRPAAEWDDMADETVGRVKNIAAALEKSPKSEPASGHDVLAAPLPAEPGEGTRMSQTNLSSTSASSVETKMSKSDRRSRGSFSDIAKLAGTAPTPTPPPAGAAPIVRAKEASGDDSGIVDFKMLAALANPQEVERAKSTPLASDGLFDDDEKKDAAPATASAPPAATTSSAPAPAATTSPAPVASTPPPSASTSAAPAAAAQKKATEKKEKNGGMVAFVFVGLAGIAAVAAGSFYYVKSHQLGPFAVSKSPAIDIAPPPKSTAPVAANDTKVEAPKVEQGTTPPPVDTAVAAPQPTTKGPIAKGTVKPNTQAVAPQPSVDPKLVVSIADQGTQKSGGGSGLSDAMKNAVGPIDTSTQTQPAAGTGGGGPAGNVPQKPSQGMVQGAINSVLPEARGCLGPDDPVSKATVVFQSDGTVKSVAVTGSASGKPAEQCIKNALGKAKVQPFAEPTFSFPVTVRPSG
jgi:hypothetical protein